MILPPGKTEAEVLAAIDKAVNTLAPTYVFGPYDIDDIKQEGRRHAIEVLAKGVYDPTRPLENFLYTHIKNRLINLKRDKLRRNDAPCRRCHDGDPCGGPGSYCATYREWLARNNAKANLMRPLDLGNIADEREKRTRVNSTAHQDAEL